MGTGKHLKAKGKCSDYLVSQFLEHEGHRLAMKVARGGGHWGVDVSMGIHPDEAQIRALLGMALHRANSKAVPGGKKEQLFSSCPPSVCLFEWCNLNTQAVPPCTST